MKIIITTILLAFIVFVSNAQTIVGYSPAGDTIKAFIQIFPFKQKSVITAPTISYPASSLSYQLNSSVNLIPTVTGSPATYSIDVALPTGMNLNGTTGVITGSPQVAGTGSYKITAKNTAGSSVFILSIIVSSPNTTTIGTTVSGAVALKSNTNYSGLIISINSATQAAMSGNGLTNINITNCKIINPTGFGINLTNCSKITVTNCFFNNVGFGFYCNGGSTINISNNQFLNINGVNTSSLGHAIQFNSITGSGNRINNNRIESIAGVALHPHDVINVYKSSGIAGDSLQVIGNWIRGGQTTLWPTSNSGAAGIVVGDLGGNYQVCRNNILVNPGYVGIQAQGGNHIMVDHNKIYSSSTPAALVGMSWGNYSSATSSDVTYAYNEVKWFNLRNLEDDFGQNGTGVTLVNNTWGAAIDASILPTKIITFN